MRNIGTLSKTKETKNMIQRLMESKISFAITSCAFLAALGWNASQGAGLYLPGHGSFVIPTTLIAHGPTLPPDPWEMLTAHGPTLPPDPWEMLTAHGPTLPPDPWEMLTAHGPTLPPDPWEMLTA